MDKVTSWLQENLASLLVDILLISAAVLVSVGIGMFSTAAGVISAGAWCFLLAVLLAKGLSGGGDSR